jgi:hypothetical protein
MDDLTVPGGGGKPKDGTPFQAALREGREETYGSLPVSFSKINQELLYGGSVVPYVERVYGDQYMVFCFLPEINIEDVKASFFQKMLKTKYKKRETLDIAFVTTEELLKLINGNIYQLNGKDLYLYSVDQKFLSNPESLFIIQQFEKYSDID